MELFFMKFKSKGRNLFKKLKKRVFDFFCLKKVDFIKKQNVFISFIFAQNFL